MAPPVRVLLTGAGGYVGSRLAAALKPSPDVEVRALVRKPIGYVEADDQAVVDLLGDGSGLIEACRDVDTIVHLASHNEVVSAAEPERTLSETLIATRRVAAAAVECGVRRIVYLSTVHAYGARMVPGAELAEDVAPAPRSDYAIARVASEYLLAAEAPDVELVVFRLTNSVGAPTDPDVQRWTLVTNDLSRQAALTGTMRLLSSGAQWRDFIALSDVCNIVGAALQPGALAPGTYNLASGRSRTVRQLAVMVQDAFEAEGAPRPALEAPDLPPDPPGPYHVSTVKLAAQGLSAPVPLEEAVAEVVRFCLDHRDQL
jgi:UDP-glucose 4-epimerase